jgi:hypothetical protein
LNGKPTSKHENTIARGKMRSLLFDIMCDFFETTSGMEKVMVSESLRATGPIKTRKTGIIQSGCNTRRFVFLQIDADFSSRTVDSGPSSRRHTIDLSSNHAVLQKTRVNCRYRQRIHNL